MSSARRYSLSAAYPAGLAAMTAFSAKSSHSGIDPLLAELIKIRASQLNECAYCLDMHTKDARALGETEQRIYALSAWRETPFFTEPERAALAFTEALTVFERGQVDDAIVEDVRTHFDDETFGKLVIAIVVINSWNRLMAVQQAEVGSYLSKHQTP